MSKILFLLTLTTFLAVGCDNSQKGTESKTKPKTIVLSELNFTYDFNGKNGKGKRCSTGAKSFSTLHLMCINIQDPIQNNDCAEDLRIEKFRKECEPKGYTYFESITCRFTLLDKNAEINAFTSDYDPKFKLQSFSACAGHTSKGLVLPGLSVQHNRVYEDVFANVSIRHYSKSETTSDRFSHFKLEVYGRNGPMIKPALEYTFGELNAIGQTEDQAYKYLLQCEHTWACDAKNK